MNYTVPLCLAIGNHAPLTTERIPRSLSDHHVRAAGESFGDVSIRAVVGA